MGTLSILAESAGSLSRMVRTMSEIVTKTSGDLIDARMDLSVYCGRALGAKPCGRKLDVDARKLADLFGRDAGYVRCRFPLKCKRCNSTKIEYRVRANTTIATAAPNPFARR